MRKLVWLVGLLLTVAFALPANADEITFRGFGLGTLVGDQESGHIRLSFEDKLSRDFDVHLMVTPLSPPFQPRLPLFTYADVTWHPYAAGVDGVLVGELFPPFGNSWWNRTIDAEPEITFSDIYVGKISVRQPGVSVTGHSGAFRWYGAVMSASRLYGDEPNHKGAGDVYLRGEYAVRKDTTLGVSERLGAVPATEFDVAWHHNRTNLMIEAVRVQSEIGVSFETLYQVNPRFQLAIRPDWVPHEGTSLTAVGIYTFRKGVEIHGGRSFGPHPLWLAQLVTRW